jgi:heat shock protein HslJ
MNLRSNRIGLMLACMLAFTACGTDDSRPMDGDWVLIAATVEGDVIQLDDQPRVTMTIGDSEISGRAACNTYSGAVSIDDGAFSVGAIAQTEMACEPSVMELESTYLKGLFSVTNAARSGDTASLTGDGIEYMFELVPAD